MPSSNLSNNNFQILNLIQSYIFTIQPYKLKLCFLYSSITIFIFGGWLITRNNIKYKFKNHFPSLYNFFIFFIPIISILISTNLVNLKNYISSNIFVRNKIISDEMTMYLYIFNNLKPNESILQHPNMPPFRRRLPNYFSVDRDLMSILPYVPNKISNAICELESNYRISFSGILKKGTKRWSNSENSFRSKLNWVEVKNYHASNNVIKPISEICQINNYKVSNFNYILESTDEVLIDNQKIIFSNNKYRLSKIIK